MQSLYNINGLMFWSEKEIKLRKTFENYFSQEIKQALLEMNPSWTFHQIEAPLLTPTNILNPNYTGEDIWLQETDSSDVQKLALRPETTPGSYVYGVHLLETQTAKPPFVIWQSGKSFRREQDQVTKNMRLKEFYQQEFQCVFSADTLNDYHTNILEPVRKMIDDQIGFPTRLVNSDRLPQYSRKTIDVEVDNEDKWMEVCSISLRTDFPIKAKFQAKNNIVEKELLVLELAIGLDRCVYNWIQKRK